MTHPEARHIALIVMERPEQLTGSGCCGKLEGVRAYHLGRPVFEASHLDQEQAGPLLELFTSLGPDWEVHRVDPRNLLGLWPLLWTAVRRHRPPLRAALRTLCLGFSPPAIIVDGRVASSRRLPSREWLEGYLQRTAGLRPPVAEPPPPR